MEDFTLNIDTREAIGKTDASRLRRNGRIPAVGYRAGEKAIPFSVEQKQFLKSASKALPSQVFKLEGSSEAKGMALVKDIQREGLKGKVLHIDFLLLKSGEPAVVNVPIVITGTAPGVKNEGGVLNTQCRKIVVLSPPESIPDEIEVSIGELNLGDRIRTGDIKLPDGVVLKSSPEETVANIISGRAAKLAEEAAEQATATEGDSAAAPAEGGDAKAPEAS